jgi:hypothetical protein
VARVRFGPDGRRIDVIDSGDPRHPSEIAETDPHTQKSKIIYRSERFFIQDLWITANGTIYLSGIQPSGLVPNLIPVKVNVVRSSDHASWNDMPVDYRAVARRTMFASGGKSELWLATDTGMLLSCAP